MLLGFAISLIGLFFLIINAILFVKSKEVRKKVSNVFVLYLITLAVIEVCCHIIGFLNPNTNFFLSHFYFIFQFVFLSYLFYTLFNDNRIRKVILVLFVGELGLIAYSYMSKPSLFWEFNPLEIISTSILLVAFALLFIIKNLDKLHDYFNFSLGIVMYLICSIYIFLSGNTELVFVEDPYIDIWVLNAIFYIFFQFMVFKEYLHFSKKEVILDHT